MLLQEHEIPTIVIVDAADSDNDDIASNVVYSTTDSGTISVFMDHSRYLADFYDSDTTNVEVTTLDSENSYSSINNTAEIVDLKSQSMDIVDDLFFNYKNNVSYNIDTEWYLSPSVISKLNDTYMALRVNLGSVPVRDDVNVDIYLSNVSYHSFNTNIYCCAVGEVGLLEADIIQDSGRITRLPVDLYSAGLGVSQISTSIYNTNMGIAPLGSNSYCCSYSGISYIGDEYPGGVFCSSTYSGLLNLCSTYSGCEYEILDYCINMCSGTSYFGSEVDSLGYIINTYSGISCSGVEYINYIYDNLDYRVDTYPGGVVTDLVVTSGSINNIPVDVYSTALGISTPISVDFKTRSLFTGDFFLERDHFTTACSIAWVDIIDYLYPIDIDNTFFYVEGVLASGIYFEDIPNGKRMYYDPIDDFYSRGVFNYSIHAENIIGEVEEKDFYFLYGYDLQLDEVVDWGPNKQILVRAEAKNLAFCPGTAGAAFDFETVDLTSFNLPCSIMPVSFMDLNAEIAPQSTVFFYGKTYTVRLSNVKDFAGNIMPDLEYTFTIEDPLA